MADKAETLPTTANRRIDKDKRFKLSKLYILILAISAWVLTSHALNLPSFSSSTKVPQHAQSTLSKCAYLDRKPGPSPNFNLRTQSDRYEHGTRPTLIKNATLWTGRVKGLEVLEGDVLLDKGIIKAVGEIEQALLDEYVDLVTVNAFGSWVTPGIVDMHSHLGVDSSPYLKGADDTNSLDGITQPWLRSVDGINTHDDAYILSISGGVTTSNILPGSANAIGGQAFPIKLRPTKERSTFSMLLEPPYSLNGSVVDPSLPPRWRQMKHACGENPSRVYSGTRMDTIWAFREAYNTARKIRDSQNEYCAKAVAGQWDEIRDEKFPEELQWEALVDVLRGRVKVQTHCYEAVDLNALVRLSNEFKFPIAAFHHASEAYLVPDLLKKAYDSPPAIALFATNGRYKREAYRASEFAPKILTDNGLKVAMKSDHPVLNSRYLLYEAQQAHYYGLPSNVALSAVISTPAEVMGYDHRIGFLKEGYDADVVIWDSHPLSLGAAPRQVWIDGIPQLKSPHSNIKPASFQKPPLTPNFDKEAYEAVKYDGLPPLNLQTVKENVVIFTNVSSLFVKTASGVIQIYADIDEGEGFASARSVVVEDGVIVCDGSDMPCIKAFGGGNARYVNLEGGSLSPGLVSFGSPMGLEEIQGEASTHDGKTYDFFDKNVPGIVKGVIICAVDGLQFGARDTLYAYQSGVTTGVVAPSSRGFLAGIGTAFSTGAGHRLEKGAVIQTKTALHIQIGHMGSSPTISTQISILREWFLGPYEGDHLTELFSKVAKGSIPLVITVHSADIIASLLSVKREVEKATGQKIKMTLVGAAEAHLLAKELGEAGVGVILNPARPYPAAWESRRILPGPPLSKDSAVGVLISHNVTVGLGIGEQWDARNIRFNIAWAALEAHKALSKSEAIALGSTNLENLLGLDAGTIQGDLVATRGGTILDFGSRVVGLISASRGVVDIL